MCTYDEEDDVNMLTRDMKVCVRTRQGGKTTALLDWLCEPHPEGEVRVGVFAFEQEAMRVLRMARSQGRDVFSWQFVSAREISEPGVLNAIHGDIVLGLDDVDIMLVEGFRRTQWPIRFMTITGESV